MAFYRIGEGIREGGSGSSLAFATSSVLVGCASFHRLLQLTNLPLELEPEATMDFVAQQGAQCVPIDTLND